MPTDTGLEEIALENLQASKARLRGDGELPTRDEVIEAIESTIRYKVRCTTNNAAFSGSVSVYDFNYGQIADALIARGWLRVRES